MTCATTGRIEHGTTRTSPNDSPLTIGLGWEYYKNLSQKDFENRFNLSKMFSEYRFWIDWSSYDLYFVGIKKQENRDLDTNIKLVFDKVDEHINGKNSLKIHKYRKIVALSLGDEWFKLIRHFGLRFNIKIIKYIHDW
jgi:hypothetical protein